MCSVINTPSSCQCSEFKMNFVTSLNNTDDFINISAPTLPMTHYDMIIGYPTKEENDILDKVKKPKNTTTISALAHVLLGALLNTESGELPIEIPHITDLLDGSPNDGDDISELFNTEAPWDVGNPQKEPETTDLIDLIHIEGSPEFKEKIKAVCNKYKHCFSLTVRDKPAAVIPLHLEVDKRQWEVPRNSGPPRMQSDVKQEEIKRQIDKLLLLNVIRPSQSPYYSHPHLTRKPDDSWRFCIDYRQLNNASKALGWPIPNIEQLLRRVGK